MTDYIFSQIQIWAPKLSIAILILLGFYVVGRILKKLIVKSAIKLNLDPSLAKLIARTVRITLWIFAVVTALGTLGIDISALVAGLGLTGFALGFALKDTISNLLSGVLILFYRPFKVGDAIKVAGFEGKVNAIDLRYTELLHDGDKVLIPNSKLFTDPIRVLGEQQSEPE